METTEVYNLLTSDLKRINLLRGSARSGKTHSLLQMAVKWLWEGTIGEQSIPTGIAIIARETFPSLRRSVLREFIGMLRELDLLQYIEYRRTTHEFEYMDRQIFFLPLDEESKILGMQTQWFWINEGNRVKYSIFNQLLMRCGHYCFLDYNPWDKDGWINQELELKRLPLRKDVHLTISTFRMNPYLPEAIVKEIEELYHTDRQLYEVYANGNWMQAQGLIFPKYHLIDKMPDSYDFEAWGADWGFEDENVLVRVLRSGSNLYIDELLYKNKVLVNELAKEINAHRIPKLYCDSARPDMVQELRRRGINAKKAKKGKDSIIHGINKIRQHHIHITERSLNIIEEFKKYVWATDDNGNVVSPAKPIDAYNHGIDSVRYALSFVLKHKMRY